MHKHSHLHRRHDGAMDKLQDEVHDLVARQHHHHSSQDDSEGRADQDRLEARDDSDNGPGNTAVSIVYVTAAPTFTGAIAGFTTIGVPAQASAPPVAASPSTPVVVPPPQSSPAPPSDTPLPPPVSTAAATTAQPSTPTSSPSLLSSIVTHSTDASSSTTLVASTVTSSSPSAVSAAASAAASTQAPSVTTDKDSVNSGLSGGAKAGIAIGVILGVLALVAAVFALLRLKKRREEEAYGEALNEKNPFADHAAAPAPPQTSRSMVQPQAPVLPPMGIMGAAPTHGVEKRADSPTNPFGPGAETVREVNTAGSGAAPSSSHSILGAAAAGAVGGVAAATVAKRTSIPAPLKISRAQSPALAAPVPAQASPAVSQFSEASTANTAVAAAAATGNGPKMHRVQMDFNPTMDDELKIRAGEIVEIMHEYDDGWVRSRTKFGVLMSLTSCSASARLFAATKKALPASIVAFFPAHAFLVFRSSLAMLARNVQVHRLPAPHAQNHQLPRHLLRLRLR